VAKATSVLSSSATTVSGPQPRKQNTEKQASSSTFCLEYTLLITTRVTEIHAIVAERCNGEERKEEEEEEGIGTGNSLRSSCCCFYYPGTSE